MSKTNTATLAPARRSSLVLLVALGFAALFAVGMMLTNGALRDWWSVVLLGIIEGLTEFLPISSTAHLLIASDLLRFQHDIGGTFEIFIQLGAILAVVGYYARDLSAQARAFPTSDSTRRFWFGIVLAFIPAAVVGLLFRKVIKAVLFESPTLIAWSLIIGGVVLIAMEHYWQRPPATKALERVTIRQAFAIGIAQVFALVPGVSRSGASIVGGRLAGLDRSTATAFSFYLSIPTLGAATVVDLAGSLHLLTAGDIPRLIVGTLVSFVVAWACIGWLLRYVAHHSFVAFGVYRIVAGIIILALVATGVLHNLAG